MRIRMKSTSIRVEILVRNNEDNKKKKSVTGSSLELRGGSEESGRVGGDEFDAGEAVGGESSRSDTKGGQHRGTLVGRQPP